ncbi:GNAT family N-acetyltransferase [Parvibaculaceae bacterium PLY_AMNH_Bact1]|nr:GNAT family N-acetyltransferase [Parvibaculaceae bacterium PLY_AMNH_Bact1]
MAIRRARSGDIAALQEIAANAYKPYVARMGQEPAPMRPDFARHIADDTVFVWDEGGVSAYAVIVAGDNEQPLLENIAVDPEAQGWQLGSKLLDYVEGHLRQGGARAYTLYTNVHMTENIAWYTRAGFVETGRGRQDGFDRVFFRKAL